MTQTRLLGVRRRSGMRGGAGDAWELKDDGVKGGYCSSEGGKENDANITGMHCCARDAWDFEDVGVGVDVVQVRVS